MIGSFETWTDVRAARLPAERLSALAPVRCDNGVTIHTTDDWAWVTWTTSNEEVLRALRPVRGVEFYIPHGANWFPLGHWMPEANGPPAGPGQRLDRLLVPVPAEITSGPSGIGRPIQLSIVSGGVATAATAIRCPIVSLARWADVATTAELADIRAARLGPQTVLIGKRVPHVAGAERFWGNRVLVPLGFRPEPDLTEELLRDICGATIDDRLVIDHSGIDVIALGAFHSLTRAGVRLALRSLEAANGR